jgi:hypothetical protein
MGAQLWYHATPWCPDPNDAQVVLQTQTEEPHHGDCDRSQVFYSGRGK